MANSTAELVVPTIYLLCHSLELALKSYLLHVGVDTKALSRRPYHHDIAHCLAQAEARGLFPFGAVSAQQREVVISASVLFDSKELNYFYEKSATLPNTEMLQSALRFVLAAVFDRISEPYFREMKKQ